MEYLKDGTVLSGWFILLGGGMVTSGGSHKSHDKHVL